MKDGQEMFSQNDSLLPSTFPQAINEAEPVSSVVCRRGQEFLRFSTWPFTASNCPLFLFVFPRFCTFLPLARPEIDMGEGHRESTTGETRQNRAFGLEIITFTLLMYGQTTKDIHRQWEGKWLHLCSLQKNSERKWVSALNSVEWHQTTTAEQDDTKSSPGLLVD